MSLAAGAASDASRKSLAFAALLLGAAAIAFAPIFVRLSRSSTLLIRELDYVAASRSFGAGERHILRRHIFPNVVNLIVAQAVITFAVAVFTETTLAFIGLGDPFAPSWGQILNAAQSAGAPGLRAWWYIAPPAVCVVLVVLAFTLVGNALDDVLNPKTRGRR